MDQPGSAATAPPDDALRAAPSGPLTIALDACGADGGPEVIAAGAETAAAEGIKVRAFGLQPELEELVGIDRVELRRAEDAISNEEEPVRAVHSEAARVDRARRPGRRRGTLARPCQRRLDGRGAGGGAVLDAPPARRAPPRDRRAAAAARAPRPPGPVARRGRQRRGAPPAPGPVRLPRLGVQRGGARGGAPSRRAALGRRGAGQGHGDGRRRARGARRSGRDRVRRQRRGHATCSTRRRRRGRDRRLHRQRRAEDDGGHREGGRRRGPRRARGRGPSPRSAGC